MAASGFVGDRDLAFEFAQAVDSSRLERLHLWAVSVTKRPPSERWIAALAQPVEHIIRNEILWALVGLFCCLGLLMARVLHRNICRCNNT